MKKILLIGKNGQVADNLSDLLRNQYRFEYKVLSRDDIDLSVPQNIYENLSALGYQPDVIINASAYTAVDQAEDDRENCNNINNLSVAEIAKYAAEMQALLIHYSTDYVFDGQGTGEFSESNSENLNPINYYGATKLSGEKAIIASGCDYIILRTSWVYNHEGKNFVKTMLKLFSQKDELKVINDQIGSPTYAYDIAEATLKIISADRIKTGIYNLVAPQQISWFQFSLMIREKAKELGFPVKTSQIYPISSSEYPTKAKRPLNSRLSTEKLRIDYGIQLPAIADSLSQCLVKIKTGV